MPSARTVSKASRWFRHRRQFAPNCSYPDISYSSIGEPHRWQIRLGQISTTLQTAWRKQQIESAAHGGANGPAEKTRPTKKALLSYDALPSNYVKACYVDTILEGSPKDRKKSHGLNTDETLIRKGCCCDNIINLSVFNPGVKTGTCLRFF